MKGTYQQIYNYEFFQKKCRPEVWENGQLRYEDALPAMAYAFGIKSYDDYKNLYGEFFKSENLNGHQQVDAIKLNETRRPVSVLDIGAGRGEVSVQLANMGIPVQAVDACPDLEKWIIATNKKFYGLMAFEDRVPLFLHPIPLPLPEAVEQIHFDAIDTVLMVESIEHILKKDFNPLYEEMIPALKKNKGLLIITNNIGWHPIRVNNKHVRKIDDKVYDDLAADASETIFRQGSHIVLRYE